MAIQKNTALNYILFRMIDAAGASVAGTPTCKVSLDGGSFTGCSNSPASISSGAGGEWRIALTAAELNTTVTWFEATLAGAVTVDIKIYPEADYTTTRAGYLDNLDTTISSRLATSAYTTPPSTGNILTTLTAQGYTTTRAGYLDYLDVAVSSRLATSAYTTPLSSGNITTVLNAQGYTSARAGYLDYLDAAISSRLASASYTTPPTTGNIITVFNSQGYTSTRAGYLDNLDTTISSRLSSVSYTSPPSSSQIASAVINSVITAPTATPSAPYTLSSILGWLLAIVKFKKTQSSTTETVYADDGTTVIATSTKSDDGTTFIRAEYS